MLLPVCLVLALAASAPLPIEEGATATRPLGDDDKRDVVIGLYTAPTDASTAQRERLYV